jgi:transcriptional regulator with GAF, ATPase, and Fis domain
VVDQLDMRRVLCVPVQSDGRPVGMLNVFVTQPRPGREELMALGAFAALTAELVRTGVELVSKNLEVAQQRQALSSRVWIEQAKGMVAATQGSPSTRRSTSYEGSAGVLPQAGRGRPRSRSGRPALAAGGQGAG